jgi:hypothetical protein
VSYPIPPVPSAENTVNNRRVISRKKNGITTKGKKNIRKKREIVILVVMTLITARLSVKAATGFSEKK